MKSLKPMERQYKFGNLTVIGDSTPLKGIALKAYNKMVNSFIHNTYTLKIDLDDHLLNRWKKEWIQTRRFMLKSLGYKMEEVTIHTSPSGRGHHIWIQFSSNKNVSDACLNKLQWLCGDDAVRVQINIWRIQRKITYWNKMFSEVLWKRKESDTHCKRCKILRKVKDICLENDKRMKK